MRAIRPGSSLISKLRPTRVHHGTSDLLTNRLGWREEGSTHTGKECSHDRHRSRANPASPGPPLHTFQPSTSWGTFFRARYVPKDHLVWTQKIAAGSKRRARRFLMRSTY